MKMKKTRKRYVGLLILVALALIGGLAYRAFQKELPDAALKTPMAVQKDANLDRESDRPVAREADAKPLTASDPSLRSCRQIDTSIVKRMTGEGYVAKTIKGDATAPSDLEVCEYTKSDKKATVIVYDYGIERTAEMGKAALSNENTVVGRQGSVVVAVSYRQGDSYRKDPAQKALDEIIKSL